MEEPSEEANEEMDRLEAEAKGETNGGSGSSTGRGSSKSMNQGDQKEVDQLIDYATKTIPDWNVSTRDGMRKAAQDLVTLFSTKIENGTTKMVDIPTDPDIARQRIGQLIASSGQSCTLQEMIPLIVQEFGFIENKIAASNKKRESIAGAVMNPANTELVAVFQELAELYYKTGNANAGSSYSKVVKALADLSFPVTAENAKSLAKGKNKVANIGQSTADKIYEYCTTGTLEKLNEKRADYTAS